MKVTDPSPTHPCISLFQIVLVIMNPDITTDDINEEIRMTLIHEIGHWLGLQVRG
jgi:predicted Zn-dependent protease with MMP-like domain